MIFFPILMPPRFELHRSLDTCATYLNIFFVASHGAFAMLSRFKRGSHEPRLSAMQAIQKTLLL